MSPKTSRIILVLSSAILFVGVGSAHAQVCVDPAGGGCSTTIQAGIDAATAGQTVTVAAATYEEAVTIPVGKDGLTISAKRAVLDNPSLLDGIVILSNNVTISGLTIRNGQNGIIIGEESVTDVSGIVLTKMTFEAQNDYGILMSGSDSLTVEKCSFFSCGSACIRSGDYNEPDDSDNVTIVKNRFDICDSNCVNLLGDSNVAIGNRCVSGEDGECITIEGNNAVVEKNKGSYTDGLVRVSGENPRVVKNKIRYSGSTAIRVNCTGNCAAGAIVDSNSVREAPDSGSGFRVSADAPGMIVSNNTSVGAANRGFDISGVGIVVRDNVAFASGGDTSVDGFHVEGADHSLTNNVAVESADDGFSLLYADNITLEGNLAQANFGDGFSLGDSSENVVLENNTAVNNLGEGFELFSPDVPDPVSATLTGNTSTGNRTPFCVSILAGGPVDGGGNSFTVPGAPACEVNH